MRAGVRARFLIGHTAPRSAFNPGFPGLCRACMANASPWHTTLNALVSLPSPPYNNKRSFISSQLNLSFDNRNRKLGISFQVGNDSIHMDQMKYRLKPRQPWAATLPTSFCDLQRLADDCHLGVPRPRPYGGSLRTARPDPPISEADIVFHMF